MGKGFIAVLCRVLGYLSYCSEINRGGYWQDIAICLFVIICSLIDRFTALKITSRWIVEPLGFAYGIVVANHSDSIRKWLKDNWLIKYVILFLLSGILGISYLKLKTVAVFGDYFLKIALGIAITAFVFEAITKFEVGNKINSFLGEISYEIYLLHHGVFALLTVLNSDMNSGVFIITSVAVTVALAFVLNRICRPIVRLLR